MAESAEPAKRVPRTLAPLPFTLAVAVVYLLSFGSQMLLAPPTTGRFGVVPFGLGQAALIAIWIVLHVRRLRDAGQPPGLAYGIAVIYAIEVVLLAIVIGLMLTSTAGTSDSAGPDSSILNLFVILYFLTLLSGDPSGGVVQIWIAGFVILLILPVVVALVFSIWAATRRRHTTTA
jgi:uncharacterized membrane protein YhaH (DUF805 family)